MSESPYAATTQATVDTNAGPDAVQGTIAEADTSGTDDVIADIASEAGYEAPAEEESQPEAPPEEQQA